MLGLEVSLNGKKLCVAGVGDSGVVATILSCVLRDTGNELILDTGGIAHQAEQHLRWHKRELNVGDEVTIRIVDVPTCDAPSEKAFIQP